MPTPRLVFLGLDGLPFSLARTLCQKGLLPALSSLIDAPGCRPIRAELPELSPVNWSSFFTASSPGEHGVYGFTRINPETYSLEFTDFTHVHGVTLMERMARQGFFAKVLNMPNLAPVRPVKSMLVAGFPAQNLDTAVYPAVLQGILRDAHYSIEADTVRGATDPAFLLQDLARSLACRRTLLRLFWPDLAWNLFALVLTETDRLGHFLFPAMADETHPWHRLCLEFLRDWDALIAEILERYHALPEPKRLILMADHGFTTLHNEVDLNVWLAQHGLLRLEHPPQNEWDASGIGPLTRAFALDPGRIYLHTKERFARGRLHKNDAAKLKTELSAALRELTLHGKRVLRQVHAGTELYHGPYSHLAPDLVLEPEPGFDLKGKFNRHEIFGFFGRQGMHSADDTFFYDSLNSPAASPAEVGQAVLNFFGLSIQPFST